MEITVGSANKNLLKKNYYMRTFSLPFPANKYSSPSSSCSRSLSLPFAQASSCLTAWFVSFRGTILSLKIKMEDYGCLLVYGVMLD